MKRLFPLVAIALLGCNVPVNLGPFAAATATPAPTAVPTRPGSDAPLGSKTNPLVLALLPSTQPQGEVLAAGNALTSLLKKATGYDIVSVIPPNEPALINAFGQDNAHIAVLTPYAYLEASENGEVEAAFAREQNGNLFYGAQLIARSDAGFTVYYDPIQKANLAEAPVALAQFADKKPCWTDPLSPSGYVVPLGYLGEAEVAARDPAFLTSHPAVVRAVYAGGICDFGATYIDARTFPGLEDALPGVLKQTVVIWQIPAIIPYETLVYARSMPLEMRRLFTRAFVDLMGTPEGHAAVQTLYGFSAMQVVQDSQYADFRRAVKAARLDWTALIK